MPDEKTQGTESLQDTRWASLIEELRQWPSDAPEWEAVQVQEFIDQVKIVVGQKCQEREEEGRLQLQQALNQLRENHETILVDYFKSSDLSKWEAASCPIDRVEERVEVVKNLLAQLSQRQTLDQQVPQNHLEGRKKWTDLGAVEDRISKLVEQLDQDFSTAPLEPSQALDKAIKEDDQPPPEPPSPEQGPSSDSPDSDQEQTTDQDVSPPEEVPPEEPSRPQKEEAISPPEEDEPTPSQAAPSESQTLDKKPPHLRSVQDLAVLLQKDDSDEHWVSLGWSLLAEGDWAGAYWLARSLKAADRDVPVTPELLAVLQGAHWLENDTDSLVFDIQQIASEGTPQSTTSDRLLGLAAALRPSLVAQHTGLVSWLPQKEEVNPVLGTLAEAVRTFASAGHSLRPEDLQGVEGIATREQVVGETVEQARRFLATNQVSKLKLKRATDVLHHLVRQNGDLHFLLTAVIENKADQVDQVRQRMIDFEGAQAY